MTQADILFVIAILGISVTLVGAIIKLASRITALETKVDVFWRNVSIDAAKLLHSPHEKHRRRDELIEKYIDDTLTIEELREFVELLIKTKKEGETENEKFYASYILNAIQARYNFL